MNILYISSKKRWGGVASWMHITAAGLQKRGHNVWILSHPNSKINAMLSDNPRLISRRLGSYYSPLSIIFIAYIIKSKKIDLVVTNIDKEVANGGIAAQLCKVPNVRRIGREDDFSPIRRKIWNQQHLVSKCIVPCNYIRDKVVAKYKYLKKDEFVTIYNGRNPTIINQDAIVNLRKRWSVAENEKIVGITCQLKKIKYVDHLIKAFSLLVHKQLPWKLIITGEGPEKADLEALADELNIKHKVIFTGFSREPILSAAAYDLAVLTSKMEGFPNSIVEYFVAGTPVIATDVGGVREILIDNYNGFLVPFGDISMLTEKMFILATQERKRREFSKNAVRTIARGFTAGLMIDRLEDVFQSVINEYNT